MRTSKVRALDSFRRAAQGRLELAIGMEQPPGTVERRQMRGWRTPDAMPPDAGSG
jgi:hypothetical protein